MVFIMIFVVFLIMMEQFGTVSSFCDQRCQEECLVFHNKYRLNHNVNILKYDLKLAAQAQEWANSGIVDSSRWAMRGEGGECWAWGNIFHSWKAVVKVWHDQEKNYDWLNYKSRDSSKVGCFQQIVWAGAKYLGCGRGIIDGLPFYVAQMDVPGVIDRNITGHAEENIKRPSVEDIHWFDNDIDIYNNGKDITNNSTAKQF